MRLPLEDLLALDPPDFAAYLRAHIGNDDAWKDLLHPSLLQESTLALTALMTNLDGQLGQRKAQLDALQSGFTLPGGRQEYFEQKAEYDLWRASALGFKRLVRRRMDEAKAATLADSRGRPGYNPAGRPSIPNTVKAKYNSRSLYRLAYAVMEHQRISTESGFTPEPHDNALWAHLSSISAYSVQHGEETLAEWLERTMKTPGWEPPEGS